MQKRTLTVVTLISFAIMGSVAAPRAFAEGKDLGKHSQDEIRNACNAHGGELLGISEHGSYGCEYADSGVLILCNKNQDCTGYVSARTKADHRKLVHDLTIPGQPAAKPRTQ